ncbi:hypothetical protein LINPERPRIM_LOCUS10903 [Linum perenne]
MTFQRRLLLRFRHSLDEHIADASKDFEQLSPRKNGTQGYALRFLKFNISPVPILQAEQPATPDLDLHALGCFGLVDQHQQRK